jgi:hypothetical protein
MTDYKEFLGDHEMFFWVNFLDQFLTKFQSHKMSQQIEHTFSRFVHFE